MNLVIDEDHDELAEILRTLQNAWSKEHPGGNISMPEVVRRLLWNFLIGPERSYRDNRRSLPKYPR